MSRTFSTNNGSEESLKVSTPVRLQPESCQMRCTVEGEWPISFPIVRRLQCVVPFGGVPSVLRIVAAISSSPISRGAPGRGSSQRPSIRLSAKRLRDVPAVAAQTPTCDLLVVEPGGCSENDARPLRQQLRRAVLARQRRQFALLFGFQYDRHRTTFRHSRLLALTR